MRKLKPIIIKCIKISTNKFILPYYNLAWLFLVKNLLSYQINQHIKLYEETILTMTVVDKFSTFAIFFCFLVFFNNFLHLSKNCWHHIKMHSIPKTNFHNIKFYFFLIFTKKCLGILAARAYHCNL